MSSGSFLTVEDVNSVLYEFGAVSVFHEIDTSLITDEYDFDGIRYDFCTVSRETSGNDYNYTFKIENKIWTGGYYMLDANGDYIDSDATYNSSTKVLSITANTNSIKLILELNNLPTFNLHRLTWKPLNLHHIQNIPKISTFVSTQKGSFNVDVELLNTNASVTRNYNIKNNNNTTIATGTLSLKENNIYTMKIPYLYGNPLKITIDNDIFHLTNEINYHTPQPCILKINGSKNLKLILGKSNTIILWGINPPNILFDVECGDINLFNQSDDCYLDCNNWNAEKNVEVKVHTHSVNGLWEWTYKWIVSCEFLSVTSVSDLVSECGDGGTSIFKLNGDLTLTGNVNITHDLKIIGQDHTIDLNGYGFVLGENVNVSFENVDFVNGDTAITQKKNTELTLSGCSFTNCVSSNYNNIGSCVYCDVDIESLSNPNDFVTIIDDCEFVDNHNCILSGGKLTVNNSRLHNTDTDYIDKHNVAFLYQTDGNAVLKHNIFDIDYDTDDLCSNELNIGFAQALIQIGTTARINGATSTQLLEDNKLPFSDNVYQNSSHIFAKYYYPQIENCVYTSPMLDKEDKALCYVVSGENWIWKQNVQVTRASWESENRIRKITWGE